MRELTFVGMTLGDIERAAEDVAKDDTVCYVIARNKDKQEPIAVIVNYKRWLKVLEDGS
jgi:hypothetical protein